MLTCHCCQEVVAGSGESAELYQDCHYRIICDLCQVDWPQVRPLAVIPASDQSDLANSPVMMAYTAAYQAFVIQQATMTAFFTTTRAMAWTLPLSHDSYYLAELKNISLVQAQFDQVADLMRHHRQVADYPTYTFVPPGRIVNCPQVGPDSYTRLIQTVVSDHFWDQIINSPVADKLSWFQLSCNPNCDLSIYQRYPQLPWNITGLCLNPNLSLAWLQAYPELAWDWSFVSRNDNLTAAWLAAFPDKPWSSYCLTSNANFDVSWVGLVNLQWSWWEISRHPNLTAAWLDQYPQARWKYRDISAKASPQFFAEHLAEKWHLPTLVRRAEFSLDFITSLVETSDRVEALTTLQLLTLTSLIIQHPQLNLTWLERFSQLDLDWYLLTSHTNFTWAWVEAWPDKGWNWDRVCTLVVLT